MTRNIGLDVVQYLETAGLGLTQSVNLFWGGMLEVGERAPVDAVFVEAMPGIDPTRSMGQVEEIKWPMLAVRVRGMKNETAHDTVIAVMDALRGASLSNYLDIRGLNSAPMHLGPDPEGRHLYLAQFTLAYGDSS